MLTAHALSKTFLHTLKVKEKDGFSLKKPKKIREEFYAVKDLNFQVVPGEVFGILGPNGAGKTTLLRMLGGIMTPTSGQVFLQDIPIDKAGHQYKKTIGYLSGNTKLYGRLSPRELMNIFGELYGMSKAQVKERIEEIIRILDIELFADDRIEKLSTGQTQRVSIARCLVHSPQIYIFDEPTLGLDVLGSHSILKFMDQERKAGKSVIYSTHYMEEAETLCDRIMLIHRGEKIALGTPDELKELTGTKHIKDAFLLLVQERGECIG